MARISTASTVTATANGTVWARAVSAADTTKRDSILITITNQIVPATGIVVSTQGNVAPVISVSADYDANDGDHCANYRRPKCCLVCYSRYRHSYNICHRACCRTDKWHSMGESNIDFQQRVTRFGASVHFKSVSSGDKRNGQYTRQCTASDRCKCGNAANECNDPSCDGESECDLVHRTE